MQVYAPKEKSFMAVEEQYNFGDPFSKVWKGMDTGMITLKTRRFDHVESAAAAFCTPGC